MKQGGNQMPEISQNRQIIEKLDGLTLSVGGIKEDIAGIKEQIKYQPKIDNELHKAIDARFEYAEDRIKKLEDSETWKNRLIIGTIFTSLVSLVSIIFTIYKQ